MSTINENVTEDELDRSDDNDIKTDCEENDEVYPASINVSKDDSSLYELKRQYGRGRIQLSPPYQRESVWKAKQKSELVESILMGIPLPLMYFFEDNNGVKQVVDGKQRLTALFDFLDDKFSLTDLRILKELKGKKFSALDGFMQVKLEDYKMTINVIKPPTPDRIKFDIFDRVNRGGTKLNNQEMRNAIYQGKATKLLERLKDDDLFKKATDYSIRSVVMKDRYMILRFIAFYLWRKKILKDPNKNLIEYKSNIDTFLGETMVFINNADDELIEKIENIFKSAMQNSFGILGSQGFRLSKYYKEKHKRPVNIVIFEAFAFLMSHEEVCLDKAKTKKLISNLFKNDNDFRNSIITSVDSSNKVLIRFEKMDEILKELK